MLSLFILLPVVLQGSIVCGYDMNSFRPRRNCYEPDEQPGCNEEFIEVYKHLSKSATNLTAADTYFWLFTRDNPENPEKLHKCAGKLPPSSKFNPKKRLIVLVMPFSAGFCDYAVYREWKNLILEREDCNILVCDYSWGTNFDYPTAVINACIAAAQLEIVLRIIMKQTGIKENKMYLIGHSLGAQVAGKVGYLMNGKIKRITGLDPAGPGFHESVPLKDRLDRTDAKFVDVWHTNMGECFPSFGINYDAGDVDFYINDGKYQDSCHLYTLLTILRGDWYYGLIGVLPGPCSHLQCSQYFKVSITPGDCQFVAVKCKNYEDFKSGRCNACGKCGRECTIMGYDTDKYFRKAPRFPQRYYVETCLECPYCDNSKIKLQGFSHTYQSSLQNSSKAN